MSPGFQVLLTIGWITMAITCGFALRQRDRYYDALNGVLATDSIDKAHAIALEAKSK